ncbi:hypothetical protein [Alicyclobacillus suci]|uniref:hypothetical protein n=1 Tax=Alicyclobacillus suci TaxID=2816080 RepID=UPI001A8C1D5E|nr:hypothetical protein [Alicyclobacillus suci]
MKNNLLRHVLLVVGYIVWAVLINALGVWIIGPLVKDLAIYGVLVVVVLAILWLTSIYPKYRRRFVTFTLFSLLLGQGLSSLAFSSFAKTLVVTVVVSLVLFVVALWFGKIRFFPLLFGTLAVIVANAWLPFSDWPFLTQFRIVQHSRLHIDPHNLAAAPFDVVHTKQGDALLTVSEYIPSEDLLQQLVQNATDSPDALQNVLQTAQGEYRFVEIKQVGGHIEQVTATAQDLAQAHPLNLIKTFFPFQLAHWYVADGEMNEYLSPYLTTNQAVQTALNPASYATTMQALSNQGVQEELENWQSALAQLGVQAKPSGWQIAGGKLTGTYHGQALSASVSATSVVGMGHFTTPSANQLLLVGNNNLQVFDLDAQKVVATYQGTPTTPVPNDVVVGPLAHGEADAIFVNASPAYILTLTPAGQWHKVYTATSPSFRFETVLDMGQGATQIVTDDPSKVRNAATRYFSAYRFVPGATEKPGQLERDWRVFRTNVVNVTPVSFSDGTEDLAVAIYGSGEYLILHKWNVPLLPISAGLFGIVIIAGWVNRIRLYKGAKQA